MTRDISAWKVTDKAWMAQRKAAWNDVKNQIRRLGLYNSRDFPFFKSYFLTGTIAPKVSDDDEWGRETSPELPLEVFEAPILLECWLAADDSPAHWESIKQRYLTTPLEFCENWQRTRLGQWQTSQQRYMELVNTYFIETQGTTESLFGGREEQFHRFFGPTDYRRSNCPEISDEEFAATQDPQRVKALTRYIHFYLDGQVINPHDIIWYRLDEYREMLEGAHSFGSIGDGIDNESGGVQLNLLMRCAVHARQEPERYDPLVLKMANALFDIFEQASTTEEKRAFWERAKSVPNTFDEEVLPGAIITYYMLCKNERDRERLYQSVEIRTLYTDQGVAERKTGLKGAFFWPSPLKLPLAFARDGERAVVATYRLGVSGLWNLRVPNNNATEIGATVVATTNKSAGRCFRVEHGRYWIEPWIITPLDSTHSSPTDDPVATLRSLAHSL